MRKNDHAGSWQALVDRLSPRLMTSISLRLSPSLRTRLDPADVVQTTWIRLLHLAGAETDLSKFSDQRIFAIAKNVRREMIRNLRTTREMVFQDTASQSRRPMEEILAYTTTVCSRLAHNEEVQLFLDQVRERLPAADLEILQYRGIEERPNEEVAALLGVHPESLQRRWHRIRTRIAAMRPPAESGLGAAS